MLTKYVVGILNPLVGNTNSFIKDSKHFFDIIKYDKCDPNDLIVSFDIVSLFPKIPLNEAIEVVKGVTGPQTTKVAKIFLTSTFFSFQGNSLNKPLNGTSKYIKFTVELDEDNAISFLDVLLT